MPEESLWQLWVAACIVLVILEVVTGTFLLVFLAVGSLAAAVAALLGLDFAFQLGVCSLTTIVTLFGLRRRLRQAVHSPKLVRTNAAALIGRVVRVTETIDPSVATGRVAIDGDVWPARGVRDEVVPIGARVRVERIDGITLVVSRADELLPAQKEG